ncbi:ATP-binding cassette domain-containing protein [Synergistaceae bacterium OttesenSCG-928-I11]|nr:ATP-binding cassette domain-containing protein [Synergistaceae bacterium OttesenSCG-928-I11]
MPGDAIEIKEIRRTFDKGATVALDGVSATIGQGQITGLVGPDGAGKTTLLRLVCGLLLPDSGTISVCGRDPDKEAVHVHELIGYMPQKFGLYEDLTVMENMRLYANLREVPNAERQGRYDKLLEFTQLGKFKKRLAGALSGGMKQKLGLACTLLAEPRVLLLDEPGVGVDPVARRELWSMVRDLATGDRIVVWSTAYLDEAEACDSVILLNEGKLLYRGTPGELSSRAKGRVYLVDGAGDLRRSLIVPLLKRDKTVDVVIQGSRVRVVTGDGGEQLKAELPTIRRESEERAGLGEVVGELTATPAEPRFEDAFMDILGGARRPKSLMQDLFRNKLGEDGKREETVRADHLTKRFGDFTAVDDVSFSICQGEIFGLLGPNGAGKSTTFKMMCGLLTPTEGSCSVVGLNFRDAPGKARGRLGYMAQKFSLYGNLTVLQNLQFFSGTYGMKGSAQKNAVDRVVEAFEFKKYIDSPSGALPLGYKQRLSLACAIMHGPDVLFLDEPTSGVDPVTRREFWTYINNAVELGVTVLVTTHFMDEAEYCDRIALVYTGQVIASGSPDDLKKSVANEKNPDPTMEDAFIDLIAKNDEARKKST